MHETEGKPLDPEYPSSAIDKLKEETKNIKVPSLPFSCKQWLR